MTIRRSDDDVEKNDFMLSFLLSDLLVAYDIHQSSDWNEININIRKNISTATQIKSNLIKRYLDKFLSSYAFKERNV